uniref:Uncharacterized protein n=1 Tax=Rousettus aegyptiacus TaxID=9407 RepID=A0A7J8EK23_ROUAE|nr:hypothetical protein HJG63_012528 [Rousettus aegyptiacus]
MTQPPTWFQWLLRHSYLPSALSPYSPLCLDVWALLHGPYSSLGQISEISHEISPSFFSCRKLWLCMVALLFLPIYPLTHTILTFRCSDAQIRCTRVQVGCYLLSCRYSSYYFKGSDPGRFLMPLFFGSHSESSYFFNQNLPLE